METIYIEGVKYVKYDDIKCISTNNDTLRNYLEYILNMAPLEIVEPTIPPNSDTENTIWNFQLSAHNALQLTKK